MVALIPQTWLREEHGDFALAAPSLAEAAALCPGERFADQPTAAFCSGVLVDWDLVLTAGHCVRQFALDDFAVVFDYFQSDPGQTAAASDVRKAVEIVDEALDSEGAEPRLDYAWLRLDRAVQPPRRPAAIHATRPPLRLGDPVVSIGTGLGLPIKVDSGGVVRDARDEVGDYFVADTDTAGGSSGGGAFDEQLALEGIMVRGRADFATTDAGCMATIYEPAGVDAGEQFTYAHRAVEGLCARDEAASTICRPDCGVPCEALPDIPTGGCNVAAPTTPGTGWSHTSLFFAGVAIAVGRSRRWKRRSNGEVSLADARRAEEQDVFGGGYEAPGGELSPSFWSTDG
jgi:hypothetical protein